MITAEEGIRIKEIKANVASATPEDKQWALDLIVREKLAIHKIVMVRAKNEGFNVSGIKTL